MIFISRALVVLIALVTATMAAACPRPGTLGTSRTLVVDAGTTPRVGLKSFPHTLPLEDHEVVLTFDDGPSPPMTQQILAALERECVLATFFLVGKGATEHPAIVRKMAALGHTVAHHTWSHRNLKQTPHDEAVDEINRGIAADEAALHGKAASVPTTPFFRFPYFDSTPELLDLLQSRGIVVFGADLWASDWNPMTPEQELALVTGRLNAAGRGIILFHDHPKQTVAMMPAFLRYLRTNHYRVVHVVPPAVVAKHASQP